MRTKIAFACCLVVALGTMPAQRRVGHATALQDGMRLVYGSGEALQAPWFVSGVQRGVSGRGGGDCARFVLQRGATPSAADSAYSCIAGDTLFNATAGGTIWTAARPVGANMSVSVRTRSGGIARYETGGMGADTVSGEVIPVVVTTVTTLNAEGKPVRRLRERYSVGLGTATSGEFAAPDSTAADGWRVEQAFALRRIERP